ncbi:MAG: hypothetical protein E6J87_12525 [Deltaproteobacteria bacterium]|nr:MAG: hypothetical protein E6J87_12525 [Deltaproteobacteria bacterium]
MGYITAARASAKRRRSLWNLLLIPCWIVPWLVLWMASAIALGRLYAQIHSVGGIRILPDTLGGILIAVGLLFAWLAPAMILANLLVSLVPPARRALDREASTVRGTDRASANRGLLKLSCYVSPAGLVAVIAGLVIPW